MIAAISGPNRGEEKNCAYKSARQIIDILTWYWTQSDQEGHEYNHDPFLVRDQMAFRGFGVWGWAAHAGSILARIDGILTTNITRT